MKEDAQDETKPLTAVEKQRGVSCVCLREDGSCSEDENAGCVAWVDWDENDRQFGDAAELFCKLPKEERDKFGE